MSKKEKETDWWSKTRKELKMQIGYEEEDNAHDDMLYDKGKYNMLHKCKAQRDKDVVEEGLFIINTLFNHPSREDCKDDECYICGYRDCPSNEPLHYHHDGCPACEGGENE